MTKAGSGLFPALYFFVRLHIYAEAGVRTVYLYVVEATGCRAKTHDEAPVVSKSGARLSEMRCPPRSNVAPVSCGKEGDALSVRWKRAFRGSGMEKKKMYQSIDFQMSKWFSDAQVPFFASRRTDAGKKHCSWVHKYAKGCRRTDRRQPFTVFFVFYKPHPRALAPRTAAAASSS